MERVINNLANLIGDRLEKLTNVLKREEPKPQFTRREELVIRLFSASLASGKVNAEADLEEVIESSIKAAEILDGKLSELSS